MSKKKNKKKDKITFLEIYKKVRKVWTRNPKTKVLPNKKKKSRAKIKQEFKKRIQQGDY